MYRRNPILRYTQHPLHSPLLPLPYGEVTSCEYNLNSTSCIPENNNRSPSAASLCTSLHRMIVSWRWISQLPDNVPILSCFDLLQLLVAETLWYVLFPLKKKTYWKRIFTKYCINEKISFIIKHIRRLYSNIMLSMSMSSLLTLHILQVIFLLFSWPDLDSSTCIYITVIIQFDKHSHVQGMRRCFKWW